MQLGRFVTFQSERRTVALETGCQNVPLSFTVAVLTFPLSWLEDLTGPILIFGAASLIEFIGISLAVIAYHKFRKSSSDAEFTTEDDGKEVKRTVTDSKKELSKNATPVAEEHV